MIYLIACLLMFLATYTINILYVTVFYHRGLAHRAVVLHPLLRRWVVSSGNWVTGLDPKGWVCMHRLHHKHSDTEKDPHSPVFHGIWKVLPLQLSSYKKTLIGLTVNKPRYVAVVQDMDFSVHWLNRRQLWYLPYFLHLGIALAIAVVFQAWALAACYWLGMMSHPIQGWIVNALAHRFGYRNFATPDNSRNNTIISWLVFGEGYQNNHHYRPESAKFSVKRGEVDLGYFLCWLLSKVGGLKIPNQKAV